VACSGGPKADIFCRECALSDLVAQRKEIKRLEREWEYREVEKREDEEFNKEEEAKRELEKFEETAQGFEVNGPVVNGRGKKRKVVEVESAEVPGKHELKTGDGKVDWPLRRHNTYIWVQY
jgi:nitric oxide synthase-interacting protein